MSCCKGADSAVADSSVRETPADQANEGDGFAGSFTSSSICSESV